MKPVSWKGLSRVALVSTLLTLSIATSWGAKPDTSIPAKPEEHDPEGRPTDFKNPIRDGAVGGVPHYHVTICEGTTLGPWHPWGSGARNNEPRETANNDRPTPPRTTPHASTGSAGGTDGGVSIKGNSEGDSESTVSLTENDGTVRTAVILIHVIRCTKENKGHRGVTENATALPTGNPLERLIQDGQVKIDNEGTGETIGHIADLKLENLTDQTINCVVPPMVLESKSRKNQDYVCPKSETVQIDPHSTATVPINGVCDNRGKEPVGKGVTGDLVINTGDPNVPKNPDSHIPANQARDLLRICTSKYDAADKLQKDGALKDLPYKDKQKQKDIVVQWSTWMDPRVCEITDSPPATKDDLKKVVYKQIEEKGPMTPETKKKVDQGIDTIFEKVELTTAKAKDLEKPDQYAQAEPGGGTFEVSDQQSDSTESPPPKTQEKPKKKKGPLGKWDKRVIEWWLKLAAADSADFKKQFAQDDYNKQLDDFFKKSKHHGELEKSISEKQAAIDYWNTSAENRDKLVKERDELKKELTKLEEKLEKDFKQTEDGKKAFVKMTDAEKAANDAHKAEEEAGKYIDKAAIGLKALEELKKAAAEEAKAQQAIPAKW
jgi:hypothetical protein